MSGQPRIGTANRVHVVGVQTSDFAAYHDLVEALRERKVDFLTLAPGEVPPAHVNVVLTTAREAPQVRHGTVVVLTTPDRTVDAALRALHGAGPYRRCVVGVDPGERPGVAALADGRVVRLVHCASPEAVRDAVEDVLREIDADRFVVRVGNGAPILRDRILQTLGGIDALVEIVDERRSTPVGFHGNAERDTAAATRIALTPGEPLVWSRLRPALPTVGELRDIQRKSRLASSGRLTISRALARNVALGHLTLDEAVQKQRGSV